MCIPRTRRSYALLGTAVVAMTAIFLFAANLVLADDPECSSVLTAEGSRYTLTDDMDNCADDGRPSNAEEPLECDSVLEEEGSSYDLTGKVADCVDNREVASTAEPLACGAVLTSEGSPYTLAADITNCDDNSGPVLTVMDNVILNLNGFGIRCRDGDYDGLLPDGIVVVGSGAKVHNEGLRDSVVNGCRNGIVVLGDDNHFSRIAARYNGANGWAILGSGNEFNFNSALNNGKEIGVCSAAPDVSNAGAGFHVYAGVRAQDGGDKGGAADNFLRGNVSESNACDGMLIASNDNTLRSNYTNRNGRYGIHILSGVGGNLLEFNNAWHNPEADLVDNNEQCSTNIWRINFFAARDRDCVQ